MTRAWRDGRSPVRLALAANLVGWSYVLAGPVATFATNPSCNHLAQWATQGQWSVLFGVGGGICAAGLIYASRVVRASGAVLACGLQAAIAFSFGAGVQIGTGFGAYCGLSLLGSWLVWRELLG